MEYLIFNTDLNNFNIPCSTSLFKISKINDSVKKMNIIYSIDGDVIPERTSETEKFTFSAYGDYLIEVQPMIHVPGVETAIPAKQGSIKVSVVPK